MQLLETFLRKLKILRRGHKRPATHQPHHERTICASCVRILRKCSCLGSHFLRKSDTMESTGSAVGYPWRAWDQTQSSERIELWARCDALEIDTVIKEYLRYSSFEPTFIHCELSALFTEPLPRCTLTSCFAHY